MFYYLQVQSKASTLSSGARAAARELNVPLERMETSGHALASPTNSHSPQQNESTLHSMHNSHHHSMHNNSNHHTTNGHDQEYTEGGRKSSSPLNGHHHHHHHKSSINHQDVMMSSTSPQHMDESMPPVVNGQSVTKYSLLQFAMQHFRNE